MWLPVRQRCGQWTLTETSQVIMDTRFPNEDIYLYKEERQTELLWKKKKKLYEYIYVYIKLGKIF